MVPFVSQHQEGDVVRRGATRVVQESGEYSTEYDVGSAPRSLTQYLRQGKEPAMSVPRVLGTVRVQDQAFAR